MYKDSPYRKILLNEPTKCLAQSFLDNKVVFVRKVKSDEKITFCAEKHPFLPIHKEKEHPFLPCLPCLPYQREWKPYVLVRYNHKLNRVKLSSVTKPPKGSPPKRSGSSEQTEMGGKSKKRIKDAVNLLQNERNAVSLITLTYGEDYPTDTVAKRKHLKQFVQKASYHLSKRGLKFAHVWVIEKQERGAPHFHIVSRYFINKEDINKWWNDIVGKWQNENGYTPQKTYPNIKGRCIRGYMVDEKIGKVRISNYMAKGGKSAFHGHSIEGKLYGMDKWTSAAIKDERFEVEVNNEYDANDFVHCVLVEQIEEHGTNKPRFDWKDRNGNIGVWFGQNSHEIMEMIEGMAGEREPNI